MSKKPGLQRDLAAARAARQAQTQHARLVPQGLPTVRPDQLMPSPENGRQKLLKIDELAETLRTDGMNTAMTVIPPDVYTAIYPQHGEAVEARVADGVLFVVHHGHRRLAAALKAGLDEVPILVRREVPSLRIAAIQENLQRMALNPIEEAREFQEALNERDDSGKQLSQRELAKRVGCSQTYVSHRIALLRLAPVLQQATIDHWLKEQQLLDSNNLDGAVDTQGEGRLLLPVREAATVFSRLRADLQEAFVRGELTSAQAAGISKQPAAEQAIPVDEVTDCGVISEGAEDAAVAPLPEPRTGGSATARLTAEAAGSVSGPSSARQSRSAHAGSRDNKSSGRTVAEAGAVARRAEPRGVIVVEDVTGLALKIKELLKPKEVDALRDLLSS